MAMAASAGDVDRISALPDDLLHLILGFVRDAKSVVRTATLSRRWRRVWIYAQQHPKSLSISFSRSSLVYTSQEKVNGLLRYAMQRVVKSFRLALPVLRVRATSSSSPLRVDGPLAVVLPDHGRMTSISLSLKARYRIQLPVSASAMYEALTELKLTNVSFFGDEDDCSAAGRTLGDFVSSCCPRLRKLDLLLLKGLAQLAIRSETLETFKLRSAEDLRVLDVAAPNLGVLELHDCFGDGSDDVDNDEHVTVARTRIIVSSSRLQEIGIRHLYWWCRRPDLEIQDLTSVCRISSLRVNMHGQYYDRATDVGFWLLEKCPSVEHLDVELEHQPSPSSVIEGHHHVIADLTLEDAAPFASVRSMDITMSAHQFQDCQLVSSIFALLLKCPRLRSLSIRIVDEDAATSWMPMPRKCFFCDDQYAWTDHRAISLESLEDVRLIGFGGADEDMDLVRLLFSSSKNSIKSMTLEEITKTSGTVSLKRMTAEDDDGTETIDQKLMNIPAVDRGRWHFGDAIYTWTC
ncbi:uncharacterized protein LOC8085284 [Sorghum bicolor]|uniref:uncharacterized protein LOC8085284 n=1 Tax=Sorghum bicolor TaxID=4558 RepID=UPI000B426A68|nr:uncharacterized protein LOC8085284 [Sorghum bicolor]|eukprot:XP_021308928.1 uncharacterized protein LOC8085284 [Sorghum bicolor]